MSTTGDPQPLARLTLPDGQTIDAEVLARRRDPADGSWWFVLRLTLYTKVRAKKAASRAEPEPVVFEVPAQLVQPIAGVDYSTVGARPPAAVTEPVLVVEQTRLVRQPTMVIHLDDCWAARPGMRHVTREQAGDLVGQRQAVPCAMCGPERPRARLCAHRPGRASWAPSNSRCANSGVRHSGPRRSILDSRSVSGMPPHRPSHRTRRCSPAPGAAGSRDGWAVRGSNRTRQRRGAAHPRPAGPGAAGRRGPAPPAGGADGQGYGWRPRGRRQGS